MSGFVWAGAALALAGIAGLAWCVRRAAWLRRAEIADADVQAELRRLVAVNIAAFGVGFLGLALVVVGLILA